MKNFWKWQKVSAVLNKVKPCPFCGEYPVLLPDMEGWERYYIQCINGECACMPATWYYPTKEEAIEAWNRRVGEDK